MLRASMDMFNAGLRAAGMPAISTTLLDLVVVHPSAGPPAGAGSSAAADAARRVTPKALAGAVLGATAGALAFACAAAGVAARRRRAASRATDARRRLEEEGGSPGGVSADMSLRKLSTLQQASTSATDSQLLNQTPQSGSATGSTTGGLGGTTFGSSSDERSSGGGVLWQAVASDATELTMHERIGAGGAAVVHRAAWRGSEVAVKIWNPPPRQAAQGSTPLEPSFMREVQLLSRLRHPNILAIYALVRAPTMMIMEFGAAGSLQDLLSRSSLAELGWRRRLGIATQVACGVEFLHAQSPPIIHLDLKCGNIVLNEALVPKARADNDAGGSACMHVLTCFLRLPRARSPAHRLRISASAGWRVRAPRG
jgi:hypothetical protein